MTFLPSFNRKRVYIAHRISAAPLKNIRRVKAICEVVMAHHNYWPIAPYLLALELLDNDSPKDYQLGLLSNLPYFTEKFIDELWIFDSNKGTAMSKGVALEYVWACAHDIPVKYKSFQYYEVLDEL